MTVNNVAPTVTAAADQASDEGEDQAFDLGSFSDPGADSPWDVTINWGDGSLDTTFQALSAGSLGTQNHTYDDNDVYTVTVTVDDGQVTNSDTFEVTVANVAPDRNPGQQRPGQRRLERDGQLHPSRRCVERRHHGRLQVLLRLRQQHGHLALDYATAGASDSTSCSFADNGSYTVAGRIFDKDDGYTDYTTSVTVNNVAPTVTAAADQASDEGEDQAFDLGSFSDPGADSPWDVTINWGDGSLDTTFQALSAGSLGTQNHTYDDNDVYTVTVTVDDGTVTDSDTFEVTVANVAPTGTLGNNGPVNEGSSATVSFTLPDDVSSADTTAGFKYSFDCANNTANLALDYATAGASDSTSCSFADNGSYTVAGRIFDKDDGYTDYTTSVTVNNVAPTATFNAPESVDEGSTINLSLSAVSDPGSADTFEYRFSCDDGTTWTEWATSNSSTCSTTDNGTVLVKGQVRDDDGGSNEYSDSVTVNNVAPTATLTTAPSVNEGSPVGIALFDVVDPGTADTHQFRFKCGAADWTSWLLTDTVNCATTDNGSITVKGQVRDDDGGQSPEYEATVTINNVAPSATFNAPDSVNEGGNIALSLSAVIDPDTADTHEYRFKCGAADWGAWSGTASSSCTAVDNPSISVKGQVRDDDGGQSAEYSDSVTVTNVAPVYSAPSNQTATVAVAQNINLGSFSDAGTADGPWAVVVDWGDGSTDTTFNDTDQGSIANASHTYATNGPKTVTVCVTDKDLASDCAPTFTVTVTLTLYLHDNPTPPTINVNAEANLPLNTTAPTAGTLFNYSTDLDSSGTGRFLQKSDGTDASLSKRATWRYPFTGTLSSNLVLNGNTDLVVWARMKSSGKDIDLRALLLECTGTGTSCTTAATLDMTAVTNASTSFTQYTLTASSVSHTFDTGNTLVLRLFALDGGSTDDQYIAYDTSTYLSRLNLR